MTNRTVFTSAAGIVHHCRTTSGPSVRLRRSRPDTWRSNFGPNYAPGTGLYMQGNLNLNAIWSVDLVLDIKPRRKKDTSTPGYPPFA